MACLNPKMIFNRSEKLNRNGGALINVVSCGHCADCLKEKHNTLLLRAYYETKRCQDAGGYVYFDTLTYKPEMLPSYYGVPCFRPTDIPSFFKKLRVYLKRAGYDPKDGLRYLVTSEYGEGKEYICKASGKIKHGKKLPHYHVLFFVNISGLTVQTLWRLVRKAWINGFNDKGVKAPQRVVNGMGALNYVTKYVTKNAEFHNDTEVQKRLRRIARLGHTVTPQMIRDISPRYWQSKGFGASFLEDFDLEYYKKNGTVKLPDQKHLFKQVALPVYYQHKLFYNQEKNSNGGVRFVLSEFGKEVRKDLLEHRIDREVSRVQTIIDNLESLNVNEEYEPETAKKLIESYLGSRSLRDFAIYKVVYKGHLFTNPRQLHDYKRFYSYSLEQGNLDNHCYDDDAAVASSFKNRIQRYLIKQSTLPQWKNFDNLDNLLYVISAPVNDGKQANADRVSQLQSRILPLIKKLRGNE